MKKLLKYLKNYRLECAVAPSFKMLEALFELFVPLVMTKIIDEGITAGNTDIIVKNGIMLVLLAFIGLTCSLTAQYFAARAAIGFAKGVRSSLYEKILGFSYENIDRIGQSSLITRITNDINQVQNGVNMVLRLLLRSPFIVFGAMIMAFTINVKAALIFVVMIPLLFFAVFTVTLVTIPMYKKIQRTLDKLTGHIRENLTGSRVVRAFNAGEREKETFNKENDHLLHASLVTSRVSAILNPATVIIVNASMLILIASGANLVNEGTLTNGQVYALVNYMSQILVELVKFANLMITINKSLASASRISETLDIENALKDEGTVDALGLEDTNEIIRFEDVHFAYPGTGASFVEGMSFSVKPGQTIGIIGGTGSGKSTLASLLMRFYDTDSGHIYYKGKDIKELSLSTYRKCFSSVPQKAQLFSGTLRDNLLVADPSATDEEMLTAIRLAEAENVVFAKGEGLDMKINEGSTNLSGGQRQRLTIARALVRKAPILILDDSSSALDYATDSRLRANLKTLTDKTVFIISQRVISVKNSDMILVLDDGDIAGFGTHDELFENCPVYREICDSQDTGEEESL
ncbi:MAG: ABC transporter ATP-binding protein/permease [Lachnospiraceae bacterium]|nr:ABC transporter ATP-binding protein/permease [Lachnospiraceae bacterium]